MKEEWIFVIVRVFLDAGNQQAQSTQTAYDPHGKSSRYSSAKSLYLIPDPRFPDPRSPRVYPWYSEADDAFTRRLTHVGFLAH